MLFEELKPGKPKRKADDTDYVDVLVKIRMNSLLRSEYCVGRLMTIGNLNSASMNIMIKMQKWCLQINKSSPQIKLLIESSLIEKYYLVYNKVAFRIIKYFMFLIKVAHTAINKFYPIWELIN